LTKSSFLLSVHLDEQKKKVLAMFILFLKNMGLDVKWDTTVQSRLSNSRSARSQLAELTEKVDIAIALYNWCQTQTVPYFDAAVNRVLTQRDESMTFDLLTPYDHFFHRVSWFLYNFYAVPALIFILNGIHCCCSSACFYHPISIILPCDPMSIIYYHFLSIILTYVVTCLRSQCEKKSACLPILGKPFASG
uniref:Orexin receptor 2 n=1 Tax=Anisakis simplex TaxID=6269 RepID=A0A0M3J9D4_ANISI